MQLTAKKIKIITTETIEPAMILCFMREPFVRKASKASPSDSSW